MIEKVEAYLFNNRLYYSEGDARKAEFAVLVDAIRKSLPRSIAGTGEFYTEWSRDISSHVYSSAGDAFLEAADYLREHREALSR